MTEYTWNRKGRQRSKREESLRNRVTARMLLVGVTPVALVHALRFYWEDTLNLPGEHFSYRAMVGSFVILLSASLAWLLSRRVIGLLAEAGDEVRAGSVEGTFPCPSSKGESPESRNSTVRMQDAEAVALRTVLKAVEETSSDAFLLVCHSSGRVWCASRRFRELFGIGVAKDGEIAYSEVKTRVGERFARSEEMEALWERLASSSDAVEKSEWETEGTEFRRLLLYSFFVAETDGPGFRLWLFRDGIEETLLPSVRAEFQVSGTLDLSREDAIPDPDIVPTGGIDGSSGPVSEGSVPVPLTWKKGQRAADLTRNLLESTRSSDGEASEINVRNVIEEAVDLGGLTSGSPVVCRCEMADDLWSVEGDDKELEHVLVNLLANARNAVSEREDGEIRITAKNRYGGIEGVELTLADNGRGMPPETMEQLFTPFFQSAGTKQGAGLGLAVSGEIVRKLGGSIQCESEQGKGTVFRIFLPRAPLSGNGCTMSCPDFAPRRTERSPVDRIQPFASIRRVSDSAAGLMLDSDS